MESLLDLLGGGGLHGDDDHIHDIYTAFLAGKSPNIRSFTAYIYGSGQYYILTPILTSTKDSLCVWVCNNVYGCSEAF